MTDQEHEQTDDDAPLSGALTTAQQQPRQNQVVRQDFSGTSIAMGNAATEALVASARAMTEARWIMAMRNLRNMYDVRSGILEECKRPGFAEVATYARPVGREKDDKTGEWRDVYAEGLSIRFAEVAMRRMGNMQCKATTVFDDARCRVITVFAVDYETNATWEMDLTIPKTVERKNLKKGQQALGERRNSRGDRVFIVEATDAEVKLTAAAEISKAARTCILRLVPGEIQDEAFEACKKIQSDKSAKDPKAGVKRMLDAFADLGVRPSEIEQWLGHTIESGNRDEFMQLSKISSGIREGELVWPDVLAARIADLAERAKNKAPASPAAPAAVTAASPTPEAKPEPSKPAAAPPPPPPAAQPAAAAAATATPVAAPAGNGGAKASAGKGTAALKGALRQTAPAVAPAAPAKPTEDPREAEPGWMSGKPPLEIPPGTPPPEEGQEYRGCVKCNALLEVPIAEPPGTKCYACTAAERDAD